ncbi:MAG TPA: hypothetical protein VKY74_23535 [Chloroflexia bacterium]|nr:hypothetical protein [Chloroflexia bacterium]
MPERDARRLLEFIIRTRLATLEQKQAEFASRALDPGDQPAIMAGHDLQTEAEAADRLFPAFVAAIQAAGAARTAGTPLVFDDADPQQNAMADALIRFLVKSHLATVESQERSEGHYHYAVTIDWPAMEQTATLAGVDLPVALAA